MHIIDTTNNQIIDFKTFTLGNDDTYQITLGPGKYEFLLRSNMYLMDYDTNGLTESEDVTFNWSLKNPSTPVPEPASGLLFLLGFSALACKNKLTKKST